MKRNLLAGACLVLLAACDEGVSLGYGDASLVSLPSDAEIENAKVVAGSAVKAASLARTALELLGILPTYTCGEPRRTFVGGLADQVSVDFPCVSAVSAPDGDAADAVTLTFSGAACTVRGHTLSGQIVFRYSGGEDRLDLEVDFSGAQVDGASLPATAGYGTCGDQTNYWGKAQGDLPAVGGLPAMHFAVEAKVGQRDGLPVIGSTELLVDGTGTLVRGDGGADQMTMTGVRYELGAYIPEEGRIAVSVSGGHTVEITFTTILWKLGEASVVIDGKDPVTIPVLH